jgi:hypothetical protein
MGGETLQKIKNYIKTITISYLDEKSLEKAHLAIEIGNKALDFIEGYSPKVESHNLNSDDELLFVLFYLYMNGWEYGSTLGCATSMHIFDDERVKIYKESCLLCYDLSISIAYDPSIFYVNFPEVSSGGPYMVDNSPFLRIQKLLLSIFKGDFTSSSLKDGINLLEEYDKKVLDRRCDASNFTIANSLHGNGVSRIKQINIPKTRTVIKEIRANLSVLYKFCKLKNKLNFFLRRNTRGLLVPFKGVIYKSLLQTGDSFCGLFLLDISKMIPRIKEALSLRNSYKLFYAMLNFVRILDSHGIISKDEKVFVHLIFMEFLKSDVREEFGRSKTSKLSEEIMRLGECKGLGCTLALKYGLNFLGFIDYLNERG